MKKQSGTAVEHLDILPGVLLLTGIILTRFYGYLLFHSLAELFSVIIAFSTFIVVWNSRGFHDDNYFLFIGLAYGFVGGLDILHSLGYKGMGVFPGYETDLSVRLWIIARYVESISLLIAPLFCSRKLYPRLAFFIYTVVVALLLGSFFYWDIFPHCFVEGMGLTPFKKISEYIISFILTAAVAVLMRKRNQFSANIFRLLTTSIFLTIGSELAFTLYIDLYGLFNMVGHILKIVSFYLIYRAIIKTTLEKPYDLLFRKLKQHEESLEIAIEEAENASRAKSQFLANMSHELRTPLNSILGYAQILKRSPSLSQHRQDALDIIEQSGGHLLALINDVLDLAKIEAGKIDLSKSNIHLPTFLKGICEMIRIRAKQKGIFFRFQPYDFNRDRPLDSLPSFVYGDEKRLRQVLINLLGNAVKFTDRGGVTFNVGILENMEEKTPHNLRFQVEDTGIGISPEHLACIFEPFHQVRAAASRREGTGLGLAISRHFIQMMGSKLEVKSTRGQGSIFWFDLELLEVTENVEIAAAEIQQDIDGESKAPINPPPATVLEELYELSLMGDINELKVRIAALEQSDRRLKPFVLEMQRLIKGYRLNQISSMLESYLRAEEG